MALCQYSKIFKNNFINELDSSLLESICFFKSLEELAKPQQKILCGQTHESKCLVNRHI